MKIESMFTVAIPIDRAWEVLTDIEGIAPCLPGAQLTGVDGDTYQGKVKIKVGPVTSQFAGRAVFAEKDDGAHRAVIDAKGKDARSGNASALITAQLRADGDQTVVRIDTDLKISGKIAQFGSGMITEVSEKLLGQFVACLETKLAADGEPVGRSDDPVGGPQADTGTGTGSSGSEADEPTEGRATAGDRGPEVADPDPGPRSPTVGAGSAATSTNRPRAPRPTAAAEAAWVPPAEPEAIDLMAMAGGSLFKRVAPIVAGAVVVGVVIYVITR